MTNGKYNVGIIGTGFIGRGLVSVFADHPKFRVAGVVTRRDPKTIADLAVDPAIVLNEVEAAIPRCDIFVECAGDAVYGTVVAEKILAAGLPVVTIDSELQIISGSALRSRGVFIEAEGDQPGSLAALDADVRAMGFSPLVYGNVKGVLNLKPEPEEMAYWSRKNGSGIRHVTAFTDGTALQMEQALVANGLGATIARRGLSGIRCDNLEEGALRLAEIADRIGKPISDYVISPAGRGAIFIVARHDPKHASRLEYMKIGKGPFYVLERPFHLCYMEVPKTLLNVLEVPSRYAFNNGAHPTVQVMAVPKHDIAKGAYVQKGIGSFDFRGEAVPIAAYPSGVPIPLLNEATFKRPVREGEIVTFDDVELPRNRALEIWKEILDNVLTQEHGK